MNPFLRYLADKNSAHRQTHTQTHADDHNAASSLYSITTFRRRLKTRFFNIYTYRDFTFIVLVVSIIVDTCIAV